SPRPGGKSLSSGRVPSGRPGCPSAYRCMRCRRYRGFPRPPRQTPDSRIRFSCVIPPKFHHPAGPFR
ncbi:DUF4177 domain-containing protein, partial [Dysosmobacter welbionis]